MTNLTTESAKELIRYNIDKHGHHVYVVSGGSPLPRFAYTIGLRDLLGVELIIAGASVFLADEVGFIFDEVATQLKGVSGAKEAEIAISGLGVFSLRDAHPSWSDQLVLGALDFYGIDSVKVLQIVPDQEHWTLDIPDLERPWSPEKEPAWQWLGVPWDFPVPSGSTARTNLSALRGERITEAARWEDDYWELFAGAGPDVPDSETRVVPLGTLLALDQTLIAVTRLDIGGALWRELDVGEWHTWG